jgi:hypothetical protein
MAIDLTKVLPGSTWGIMNRTSWAPFQGPGQVTFSDNTMTLTGIFAAARLDADALQKGRCGPDSSIFSYEIINNSMLYILWTETCPEGGKYPRDSVVTVFARDTDILGTIGMSTFISTLSRVQ